MTTKIYLAGGSDERLLVVQHWMNRVRRLEDFEITHDWTDDPGYANGRTRAGDHASAKLDADAVRRADVVWVLVPGRMSEGAHFELGMAYALGKRAIISGPSVGRCLLHACIRERYQTHGDAFEALVRGKAYGTSDYYLL